MIVALAVILVIMQAIKPQLLRQRPTLLFIIIIIIIIIIMIILSISIIIVITSTIIIIIIIIIIIVRPWCPVLTGRRIICGFKDVMRTTKSKKSTHSMKPNDDSKHINDNNNMFSGNSSNNMKPQNKHTTTTTTTTTTTNSEFKDVVLEDVVFDNNSFVSLLNIVLYWHIYAKSMISKHHILKQHILELPRYYHSVNRYWH